MSLTPGQKVICRIILLCPIHIQHNVLDSMIRTLNIDPLSGLESPTWNQMKKDIGTIQYKQYQEICIGCLQNTPITHGDRVATECINCYDPLITGFTKGEHKLRNLSLFLNIPIRGLGFHYLSQIIYQLLNKEPKTC